MSERDVATAAWLRENGERVRALKRAAKIAQYREDLRLHRMGSTLPVTKVGPYKPRKERLRPVSKRLEYSTPPVGIFTSGY
jgi:hypothetical protein